MIKNKSKKNKKKGFTLIELIIVIAILAILGAILVPQITGYSLKAKKSKATSDATTICHAIAAYSADADTAIAETTDLNGTDGTTIVDALKDTVGTWPSELKTVDTYQKLKIVQNVSNYDSASTPAAGKWTMDSSGTVTVTVPTT